MKICDTSRYVPIQGYPLSSITRIYQITMEDWHLTGKRDTQQNGTMDNPISSDAIAMQIYIRKMIPEEAIGKDTAI